MFGVVAKISHVTLHFYHLPPLPRKGSNNTRLDTPISRDFPVRFK
jgi:hypothetical protein